jgi:hypothetical protein
MKTVGMGASSQQNCAAFLVTTAVTRFVRLTLRTPSRESQVSAKTDQADSLITTILNNDAVLTG